VTHNGLSNEAAQARLRRRGPNALPERLPTPLWQRFARQFRSPLIYILLFALVADAAIWVSEGATLGLEPLTLEMFILVSAAVLMTWGAAEAYSRLALSAHRFKEEAIRQ